MSKKSEQPILDKTEQQRLEREARIKRLKGKDGQKKQIKTGSKVGKVLVPVIISLAVIVAIVWGSFSLGIVHRFVTPMTVGDEKINLVEYNYHYASYYQSYNQYASYGLVPATAQGTIDLEAETGIAGYEDQTWGEYLHTLTQQSLQQVVQYSDAAREENITLSEDSKASIDDFFSSYKTQIPSDVERHNYFEQVYGRGANEDTLRPALERTLLANQYASEFPDTFDVTSDEIKAYYEENQDAFDLFTYRIFTMTVPTADQGATDEDKEALKEETEEKANELLGKLTDFDSMKDHVSEYLEEDADKVEYRRDDLTLQSKRKLGTVSQSVVQEWLTDEDREAGDKAVLNNGNNFYVVHYGDRVPSDEHMPTVRHILFEARKGTAKEEEIAEAKAAAEDALAKITDEESMIELAEELEEDELIAEHALYEDVDRGVMTSKFEAWIYDEANQVGDTGIVQTEYGFHVIYMVSRSEEIALDKNITDLIQSEKFAEAMDEMLEEERFEITTSSLGIRLAGY